MKGRSKGLLALTPILVFLGVYLVTSILIKDFYKVPVSSAFLLASIYAMLITGGKIKERINVFSSGAGDKNVLLMIWIFVMAGAFAASAKAIGSVEATVNLTLRILPGKLILAGLFLAACFISMSIGTSVGTVVALLPIAAGIAPHASISLPMITALIVGGAFFGDNLSFISDTTIAATTSQECSMADKFKANIWIAGPAALVVTIIYVFIGLNLDVHPEIGQIDIFKLIPYLAVIVLAICGINVLVVLTIGLILCAIIGFAYGMTWTGFLGSVGEGIAGMGDLIIVTMLAGGMLEIIRHNGGIDFIIRGLTKGIKGKRGAEFSIAGLVGSSNICTANNTIAIITVGSLAKDLSEKYHIDPRKTASILDTMSCFTQGLLPYGAQILIAAGLAQINPASIVGYMYYNFAIGLAVLMCIALRYPHRYSKLYVKP